MKHDKRNILFYFFILFPVTHVKKYTISLVAYPSIDFNVITALVKVPSSLYIYTHIYKQYSK